MMILRHGRVLVCSIAAGAVLSVMSWSGSVDAGQYRTITVTALGGTDAITVPVRMTERGRQVLIPGQGWQNCRLSCTYTVRLLYFHYWEAQQDKGLGRGILGQLLGLD